MLVIVVLHLGDLMLGHDVGFKVNNRNVLSGIRCMLVGRTRLILERLLEVLLLLLLILLGLHVTIHVLHGVHRCIVSVVRSTGCHRIRLHRIWVHRSIVVGGWDSFSFHRCGRPGHFVGRIC